MKVLLVSATLLALTACTGSRGVIGNQKYCSNDYLFGIISISEMVAPCK